MTTPATPPQFRSEFSNVESPSFESLTVPMRIRVSEALRVLLLMAVILICGGCGQQSSSSKAPDPMATAIAPTAAELSGFSQRTGIPIPALAEPIRFYSESGLDSAMWLQFRLPAAQFQQFIASSPIPPAEVRRDALQAGSALGYFRPWLPAAPKNYQYADTQIAPGRYVKCIFDFDDPQTTVIYIMWFTT